MIKNIKEFINKSKADIDQLLLGLLILSLPFERIPSFDVFGITIRLSLVAGAAVIARAIYLLLSKRTKLKFTFPIKILAALGVWMILIIPVSINYQRALQVVLFNLFVFAIALSVYVLYKKEYLKNLISLLFFVTIFICALAFYQFFGDIIGIPYEYTGLAERYTSGLFGFPRVQGASLEPLYFGSFMLIPTMIALALSLTQKNLITSRKVIYLLLFIFSSTIFITIARGAIYGFVVAIVVTSLIFLIKRLTSWKLVSLGLVTVILAFVASLIIVNYGSRIPVDLSKTFGKRGAAAFTQQLTRTTLNDTDERAIARQQALDLLSDNKSALVLGLGPGQFGPYIQNNNKVDGGWAIVNNLTLELLVELGIVGLALVVIFFLSIVVQGFRQVSNKKPELLSSVVLAGLIGYLASQAVQYQGFSTLYVVHIWVVAGLIMGIIMSKEK